MTHSKQGAYAAIDAANGRAFRASGVTLQNRIFSAFCGVAAKLFAPVFVAVVLVVAACADAGDGEDAVAHADTLDASIADTNDGRDGNRGHGGDRGHNGGDDRDDRHGHGRHDGRRHGRHNCPRPTPQSTPPSSVLAAPSGFTHTGNTDSSITWAWTDTNTSPNETGFEIADELDNVVGQVGANATSWTETGLDENELCTRKVQAVGAAQGATFGDSSRANNSDDGSSVKTWLSSHTAPSAGSIVSMSANFGASAQGTVTFKHARRVSGDGNRKRFAFVAQSASLPVQAGHGTYAVQFDNVQAGDYIGYVASGQHLKRENAQGGTGFSWRYNGNHASGTVEYEQRENKPISLSATMAGGAAFGSGFSNSHTAYSSVSEPTDADFTLTVDSPTQITVDVALPFNEFAGLTGAEIEVSTDGGANWIVALPFDQSYRLVDAGLADNADYAYRIRYRNGDGDVTGWSSAKSAHTPAANMAPVLDMVGDRGCDENTLLAFTATASDPDLANGDALTFALDAASMAQGMSVDAATGEFSWTPGEAQAPGTYGVTLTVTDSFGLADSETFTLVANETNAIPVMGPIGDKMMDEGDMLSFIVNVDDADLPANTLIFTLDSASLVRGIMIDPLSGEVTWMTGEADGPASFPVTVIVFDGAAAATQTVQVTVNEVNEPPVLDSIADQAGDEDSLISFAAVATDTDLPANSLIFNLDAASTALGVTIDPMTGVVSWTPGEVDGPGAFFVTVEVSDGAVVVAQSVLVMVNEVNQPPVIFPIADQTVNLGETLSFPVMASDADVPENTLTYSIDSSMEALGMSIDPVVGVFTWTPGANVSDEVMVRVTVSDESASESVVFRITTDQSAPTIVEVFPAPLSCSAARNSEIRIVFDKAILLPADGSVVVSGETTGVIATQFEIRALRELVVVPSVEFSAGESVSVVVTTLATNVAGVALLHPYNWIFHISSSAGIGQFSELITDVDSGLAYIDRKSSVLGDVDRDGDIDMVCSFWGHPTSDSSDNAVKYVVYENSGAGIFTESCVFKYQELGYNANAGAYFSELKLGDFNADGFLDVLSVSPPVIFLNNGTGAYSSGVGLQGTPLGGNRRGAWVQDFDGDGDVDIATFGSSLVNIYRNDGGGNFSAPTTTSVLSRPYPFFTADPTSIAYGDVNDDGFVDVVTSFDVFLNDGLGHFFQWDYIEEIPPFNNATHQDLYLHLTLADFNGDGWLDLLKAGQDGESLIHFNDGSGRFGPIVTNFHFSGLDGVTPTGTPGPIFPDPAVGDMDGDGDVDIVALSSEDGRPLHWPYLYCTRVFINNGQGRFSRGPFVGIPGEFTSGTTRLIQEVLEIADIDQDGDMDAIAFRNKEYGPTFNIFGGSRITSKPFRHGVSVYSNELPNYDCQLLPGPNTEVVSVPSDAVSSEYTPLLDFVVKDGGGDDGRPIVISMMVFNLSGTLFDQNSFGNYEWILRDDYGVEFPYSSQWSNQQAWVLFHNDATGHRYEIPSGQEAHFTLYVKLWPNSNAEDNQTMKVRLTSDQIYVERGGSRFALPIMDVNNGNGAVFEVTGSCLKLLSPLSSSYEVGQPIELSLAYVDSIGNVDTDVTGDVVRAVRSSGQVLSGSATAVNGIVNFTGASALTLGSPGNTSVSLQLVDDDTGTVDISSVPLILPTIFLRNSDDRDSSIVGMVSGEVLATGQNVPTASIIVSDTGASDVRPTAIADFPIRVSGTGDAAAVTWTLSGAGANAAGVVSGPVGNQVITFSGLNAVIADGATETLTLSAYTDGSGLSNGQYFVFTVVSDDIVTDATGTSFAPGQAVTSGVAPPSAANARLWLRADKGLAMNGSGVALWRDQSGGNNTASQAVTTAMPTVVNNVLNGRPVVRFDGVDDALQTGAVDWATNNVSAFVVWRKNGNGNSPQHRVFTHTDTSTTQSAYFFGLTSANGAQPAMANFVGSNWDATGAAAIADGGFVMTSFVRNNAVAFGTRIYQNRTLSGQSLENPASNRPLNGPGHEFYIGAWNSQFAKADIAELIVFEAAMSDAQRSTVEAYLDAKYNVTGAGGQGVALVFDAGNAVNTDSTLTAGAAVEPDIVQAGQTMQVLDFTVTDRGSGDGLPTLVRDISLNVGGTADASSGTWSLNAPGLASMTGTVSGSAGAQRVDFTGVSAFIADGASMTFGVNLAIPSGSALQLKQYFLISVGVDDLAQDAGGSGLDSAQAPVSNGVAPPPMDGLSQWLRADVGLVLDGNRVMSWSGQADAHDTAAQSATSAQPLVVNGGLNGRPYIQFDGVDDVLVTNPVNWTSDDFTAFVVWRKNAAAAGSVQRVFTYSNSFDNATTTSAFFTVQGTTGVQPVILNLSGSVTDATGASTLADGVFTMTSAWRKNLVAYGTRLYTDGVLDGQSVDAVATDRPLSGADQEFYLGGWNAKYATVDIAEMIVYQRALPDAERAAVEAYLNGKYNVTGTGGQGGGLMFDRIVTNDFDSTLTAGPMDETAEVDVIGGGPVPVMDFAVNDLGTADGRATLISGIEASVGGTADALSGAWTLTGPDASSVAGVVSGVPGAQKITFSGLALSVAHGSSEVYTINFEINPSGAGLQNNKFFALGVSCTGITTLASGTSFAVGQLPVTNGYMPVNLALARMWLRADAGVLTEGGEVSQWSDQTGNNFNATQTTTTARPTLVAGAINGQPVVRFDGVNDYLESPAVDWSTSDFTTFVVWRKNGNGNNGIHHVLMRTDTFATMSNYFFSVQSNTGVAPIMVNLVGSASDASSAASYGNGVVTITSALRDNAAANGTKLYINGAFAGQSTENPVIGHALNGPGHEFYIGGWNSKYSNADIAEILVFQTALSPVDRTSVESYLNLKYGVTGSATGGMRFDFSDDRDALLQEGPMPEPQSVASTSTGATDVLDFTVTDQGTFDGRPTIVTSLVIDNTGTANVADGEWSLRGPGLAGASGVASGGTVVFSGFAVSIANGSSAVFTVSLDMAANPSGTTDNGTFLLAIDAANISVDSTGTSFRPAQRPVRNLDAPRTGMKLWLRADAGVTAAVTGVSAWSDATGGGLSASQPSTLNQPARVDGALNGYPVVRFDGVNDALETGVTNWNSDNYTMFMVVRKNGNGVVLQRMLSHTDTRTTLSGRFFGIQANNGTQPVAVNMTGSTSDANGLTPVADGAFSVVTAWRDNTAAFGTKLYLNGVLDAQSSENPVTNRPLASTDHEFYIGGWNSQYANMDVAEIIVYEAALASDARAGVESYLAAKYNLPGSTSRAGLVYAVSASELRFVQTPSSPQAANVGFDAVAAYTDALGNIDADVNDALTVALPGSGGVVSPAAGTLAAIGGVVSFTGSNSIVVNTPAVTDGVLTFTDFAGGKVNLSGTPLTLSPFTLLSGSPAGTGRAVTLTADAGSDRLLGYPALITLDGTASTGAASYTWTQISGPSAVLTNATTATPSFGAFRAGTYRFGLTVNAGALAATDEMEITVPNFAPVADAGSDLHFVSDDVRTMSGTTAPLSLAGRGFDLNEDALTPSWSITSMPVSGNLSLLSPAAFDCTLGVNGQTMVPGVYTFKLTVTDENGAAVNDDVRVVVAAQGATPPTAHAGLNRTVDVGAPVALTSGGSVDADANDPYNANLTYAWNVVERPASSQAALNDVTMANPSLTPDVAGVYRMELVVTDIDGLASAPAAMTVIADGSAAAVARAAAAVRSQDVNANGLVDTGETVYLSAAAGYAGDRSTLEFQWEQLSGPRTVLLAARDAVAPSFVPTVGGTYSFRLAVNAGGVAGLPATVSITVAENGIGAPVAIASVGPSCDSDNDGHVMFAAGIGVDANAVLPNVTLLATGGTSVRWTQVGGPVVGLLNADSAQAAFAPTMSGVYAFNLEVGDANGMTATTRIAVPVDTLANALPRTNAGADIPAFVGTSVTLTGSAVDADQAGAITYMVYTWVQTSGAPVVLDVFDAPTTTFTPSASGVYEFELYAFDGKDYSLADTVRVTVPVSDAIGIGCGAPPCYGCALNGTASGLMLLAALALLAVAARLVTRRRAA